MAAIHGGSGTSNVADVDADFNLNVTLPTTDAYTGKVRMMSENDPGTITGAALLRSPETSPDFRLRVGVDTNEFTYTFNATAQNTGIWAHAFTTMTMTQSAGFLNVNAAGTSTVANNYASLQTKRYFALLGAPTPLSIETTFQITATPTANEVFLTGLGVANTSNEPVDGVWWELSSAGLKGCARYNSGVTDKVTLIANPATIALNSNSKYVIVLSERELEFWIDDVLYGTLSVSVAQSQPFLATALPYFIVKYNSALVGSSPNMIIKVGDVTVTYMDTILNRPFSHVQASMGLTGQGQDGGTMGANTFFTNSALPTTALPVNTALTANLPTGVAGGRGLATLWNLAATDMILTQAQVPTGGVNQTPRQLVITGVTLSAVSATAAWAAPAAGIHSLMFGLYFGGTAVSLAQTESGSFVTATAKAHRRKFLGFMNWTTGASPIGTAPDRGGISVRFDTPVVVNPGEYVGIFCQMHNGAAAAAGGLLFTYEFDHYYL